MQQDEQWHQKSTYLNGREPAMLVGHEEWVQGPVEWVTFLDLVR